MSNINTLGIDKLRFFTGDGNEIHMEKQYSVEWEIVPSIFTLNAFLKNPKGHCELNISNDINSYNISNIIVDDGGLIKNSLSFTPYISDEHYLYDITNNIINDSNRLSEKPSYKKVNEDDFSDDYKYTISDDIGKVLFFSYRSTNKENITAKQYQGLFNYNRMISSDIKLENNLSYYSFICNITSSLRIEIRHSSNIRVFIVNQEDNNEVQTEIISTSKETTSYIESKYDGIMYISFNAYDDNFIAYRLSDRYISNILKITINSGELTVVSEFNLVDLLLTTPELNIVSNYNTSIVSTGSDFLDEDIHTETLYSIKNDIFTQTSLQECSFSFDNDILDANKMSALYYIMKYNIDDNQYPYVRYIGSIMQDKVSTNLISTSTIVIVNDTKNNNSKERFIYPVINDGNKTYQLHFKFLTNSEMSFITTNDNVTLIKTESLFMPLESNKSIIHTDNDIYTRSDAMHFTVGLLTDIEGCYQNTMGMFIRDIDTNIDYFLGIIIFNTEVVDEDERFRALFSNFGIPDPIKYPNIFKSQDPNEEGTDWKLINEKSKQLFLTYDSIFPFAGTYKALFNAVKFLGYEDIIFKEWYKIKDTNENNRYVAILTYDTSTKTNISSILKNYNVEYGQYDRYTKLNRISMVYHLNQLSDIQTEDKLILYDISSGDATTATYYNYVDIPSLYNIYEYRNDEVLAKLYSLKNWLEHYITGINCYISDINGEGIIIDRIKTVGYVTEHEFKDIQNTGYFTPNTTYTKNNFIDSSATIVCSLNEFDIQLNDNISKKHTGVTFNDYKDYPISQFIKKEHIVKISNPSVNITVYDSCPIGALTIADEYEFIANINNSDNGSLYEFSSEDSLDNPIIINNGEITFFDLSKNQSSIKNNNAPVILIRKGNLRKTSGSWTADSIYDTNIEYSISLSIDSMGNSYYIMTRFGNTPSEDSSIIRCKSNITLSPSDYATLKYSSDNNWNTPLFEITNYNITNQMRSDIYNNGLVANSSTFFDSSQNTYILEIIDGEMKFSNTIKRNEKDCDGATILFAENHREETGGEQIIKISYSYKSDRMPIYKCTYNFTDDTNFNSIEECFSNLEKNIDTKNTLVKIPVNRLGEYTVQVNAYDSYNNIFTNISNDLCTISSKMPDIDIILNLSNSLNSEDFYRYNIEPDVLDDLDTSVLIHSIDDYILFPIKYKLYNIQHNIDDSKITYDNISYAVDTPKLNDYLILTNLTDRVYDVSINDSSIRFNTKLNSIGKLFFVETESVQLCIYDDNLQKVLWKSSSDANIKTIKNNTDNSSVYSSLDNCTITVNYDYDDSVLLNYINDINNYHNNINMYIIGTPILDIPIDSDIINFYDSSNNHRCFIPLSNHTSTPHGFENITLKQYPIDTMIKLRMSLGDEIINETAYRIVDTSIYSYIDNDNPTNNITKCGYIINGHIDVKFINNLKNRNTYTYNSSNSNTHLYNYLRKLKVSMMPLHLGPVQYCLRVNENASENVYKYNNDFYSINTTVLYNSNQLLFDSYFDDSYSMQIFDYDLIAGKEIWNSSIITDYNTSKYNNKNFADLYLYKNHPVSINQYRNVIIKTNENMYLLEKGYMNHWVWKVKTIENNDNWKSRTHNVENIKLFESINNILCVKPYILGPLSVELYCTDKYGNVISNTGGGNIYVK